MYNFIFDRKSLALLVTGLAFAGLLLFAAGILVGVNWAVPYQARTAYLPPPLPEPPAPEPRPAAARPEPPATESEEVQDISAAAEGFADLESEPPPDPAPAEPAPEPAIAENPEPSPPAELTRNAHAALREPAEVEPPPAEPTVNPEPPVAATGGYAVQVGAFRRQQSSEQIARDLEIRGYQAYVEPLTNARGSLLHTVRFGRYAERKEAARAASEFRTRERMAAIVQPAGSL